MARVDDIFQRQRMNAEMPADCFDDLNVVQTIHIDPGDRRRILVRKRVFDVFQLFFEQLPLIIVRQRNKYRITPPFLISRELSKFTLYLAVKSRPDFP